MPVMFNSLADTIIRQGSFRLTNATAQESAHPHSIQRAWAGICHSTEENTNEDRMFQWNVDQEHFDRVHDETRGIGPERQRHNRDNVDGVAGVEACISDRFGVVLPAVCPSFAHTHGFCFACLTSRSSRTVRRTPQLLHYVRTCCILWLSRLVGSSL